MLLNRLSYINTKNHFVHLPLKNRFSNVNNG